jgi:hypothetical protein
MMSIDIGTLLFGFIGGIASSLLAMREILAKDGSLSDLRNTIGKRIISMMIDGLIAVALIYAYLGSGTQLTYIAALNIGAASPLILKTLANQVPNIQRVNTDTVSGFQELRKAERTGLAERIRSFFGIEKSA